MKRLFGFAALVVTLISLDACTARVEERHHCDGGVWIEGHRGPHGRWHDGHWRCPGVVEEVEVD